MSRSFQNRDVGNIRNDSPTCSKEDLLIALAIMASNHWMCESMEIKTAILQSKKLNQLVYLDPPKEANVPPGYIWKLSVVLGWIISLCVEPGIEPATFRFQSEVLVPPLPSLRSSSIFLLLSLSRSPFHSLCASSFISLPLSFLLLLLAKKKSPEKKNELVFIYVTLPIIHFLSL